MEIVAYRHWSRVARIVSGNIELYVTLEVGPRIIRLGVTGGPNELVEFAEGEGGIGDTGFLLYGGHRLWIAPEVASRTLQPDNSPVNYEMRGDWHVFSGEKDVWNVQKQIWIRAEGDGAFLIEHRIINHTPYTIDLAAWALTMFAPGGVAYFPMPEFKSHTEKLLPDRALVLWAYTNLADPRWKFSQSLSAFRQDAKLGPQKLGSFVTQGYAAYANNGNLFIKTFSADPDWTYPDFGCNFETFSNEQFLEVESLSPMVNLAPETTLIHREGWKLLAGESLGDDLDHAGQKLAGFATHVPKPLFAIAGNVE